MSAHTPAAAYEQTRERFPFANYMDNSKAAAMTFSRAARRYLSAGSRILDFGCGPYDKTAVVQLQGFQCVGYDDLEDEWHRVGDNRECIMAFANDCGIDFRLAADRTLPFSPESFDMITAMDVFEHLHDSPRELLNGLIELLKPGGYVFITVPSAVNIRKRFAVAFGGTNYPRFASFCWNHSPWRGHVREYVRSDLTMMARFAGLELVDVSSCNHMLQALPRIVRPLFRAATWVFPGWRDSWQLIARKPADWTPRLKLDDLDYEQVMSRVRGFNGRGRRAA